MVEALVGLSCVRFTDVGCLGPSLGKLPVSPSLTG
jgi:hypothetical protein